jgi:hypothetical protein
MATVEVTLRLPEALVRDAQEFDVLSNNVMIELIQAEVDRRVMDFVNAEVHAYRAEKAQQKPSKSSE